MPVDPLAPETRDFIKELTQNQLALMNYIRSLMPWAPNEVNDILQETNLTLWDKIAEYELGTNFKAWAFTIARYKVLNHLKVSKSSQLVFFDNELIDQISAATLERGEQASDMKAHALEQCLQKLSQKQRELLSARYGTEVTVEQYADKLGRSPSSLYVTLNRLRAKLKDCIHNRISLEGDPA
ncbi:DNA-directed RNA polymerase sigma-70 factor [Oceaniferula spumae]|uniref:DNA-directed RNA polymerase sigma-70 factor n=1 Tax=Oceaniferula spumae TaxID=2979115 RepID=A0AAT9FS69_9BACT